MEPLSFFPLLKRLRWGGRRLATELHKSLGPETDYAESWEICDLDDAQSVVTQGPWAGWTLHRLVREHGGELLGVHAGLPQFPLLLKFLDACDRLSVQVHPDDRQAARYRPGAFGKTEAWVILDAEPRACVYAGLRHGVDRATLSRALDAGTVEDCLHRLTVAPGDCVFIPAGTVHALGEGVLLAEVQQVSDLTFRLFDWNRTGSDGQPRPLHIAESLDCTDFSRGPVWPVEPRLVSQREDHTCAELVRCTYFTILRHTATAAFAYRAADRCRLLMGLEGAGQLASGGHAWSLRRGETLLLPAQCPEVVLNPAERMVWLEVFWE